MLDGLTSWDAKAVGEDEPRFAEDRKFERGLVKHQPNLKAFACSLARDADVADDLVQETFARALKYRERFEQDTNLRAWLFTILKNLFRTNLRKRASETTLTEAIENSFLCSSADAQENALFLKEVTGFLKDLPRTQSNAVILVGALGHTIDEVASREGCAAGTIKSRVSRGRSTLAKRAA